MGRANVLRHRGMARMQLLRLSRWRGKTAREAWREGALCGRQVRCESPLPNPPPQAGMIMRQAGEGLGKGIRLAQAGKCRHFAEFEAAIPIGPVDVGGADLDAMLLGV